MYVGLRSPGYSYPRIRVSSVVFGSTDAGETTGVLHAARRARSPAHHREPTPGPGEQIGNNSDGPRVEVDSLMLPRYFRRADFDIVNEYLVASLAVNGVELQCVGDHPIGNFRFQHKRFIDKHPPTTLVAGRSNAISSIRRKSEVFLSSSKLLINGFDGQDQHRESLFAPVIKKPSAANMRRDKPLSRSATDQLGLEADASACSNVIADFDVFRQRLARGDRCCIGRTISAFAAEDARATPFSMVQLPFTTCQLSPSSLRAKSSSNSTIQSASSSGERGDSRRSDRRRSAPLQMSVRPSGLMRVRYTSPAKSRSVSRLSPDATSHILAVPSRLQLIKRFWLGSDTSFTAPEWSNFFHTTLPESTSKIATEESPPAASSLPSSENATE